MSARTISSSTGSPFRFFSSTNSFRPLGSVSGIAACRARALGNDRLGGVPQDPEIARRWKQGHLDPIIVAHLRSTDEWTDGLAEVWSGPGSLAYNTPTDVDPWHRLSVKEIVSCRYGWFNAYLPYGKVLTEY